ncbi:hypothetical protein GUJ93_ZPchr0003g18201 [Zizania palustris]|uniref:Uncharacterized protein n=1 Tax=Zizania palustris TaxID=103762 RepID=A0A8J5S6P1_ZIZPA|nr:hypothetical protein GUJ93_ZPchr0003g18201 [Zizania palustris]KAG8061527.1 hypothetical protein GUJ93_ZPchr0003g18201 [Zizania palustris]
MAPKSNYLTWGTTFFLDVGCLGQSRAKSICLFPQELNDAVKANFVEESPVSLIDTNPSFFSQFTNVVATQLPESSLLKLDGICRKANIVLVAAHSYGLTGLVREHNVIESKQDHFLDDLRLHNPWAELNELANSIDINDKDSVVHKYTPYIDTTPSVATNSEGRRRWKVDPGSGGQIWWQSGAEQRGKGRQSLDPVRRDAARPCAVGTAQLGA